MSIYTKIDLHKVNLRGFLLLKNEIRVAGLKAAVRQTVRDKLWQRRHAAHEIEMKNSREDRDRLSNQSQTQPA
jgi:hypothetical protein